MEENTQALSTETEVVETPKSEQVETPSIEDLMKKVQTLEMEKAKLKKATDKATSEASNFKKQLRERMSADEQAAQEQAEAEKQMREELESLRKQNALRDLEKNFALLGYSEEMSSKAAVAQYDNDTETLFKIQSEFQKNLIKTAEAEWLSSRPSVNAGVGATSTNISKEQFNSMGYLERLEFMKKDPETYAKYTN